MEIRFYQCEVCKKIIAVVKASDAPTICCGRVMKEIEPVISGEAKKPEVK